MNTNRPIAFSFVGQNSGHKWTGNFIVKTSITKREEFIADEFRRRALGPDSLSAPAALQTDAYIAGQLFVHIVEAPKWWKDSDSGLELDSRDGVAYAVYDALLVEIAALKAERSNGAAEAVKSLES